MKYVYIVLITIVIGGCAQSGYQQSYLSYVEDPYFEQKAANENPLIIPSQNIRHDIKTLNANRYVVIGYSSFEGKLERIESIQAFPKQNVDLTHSE